VLILVYLLLNAFLLVLRKQQIDIKEKGNKAWQNQCKNCFENIIFASFLNKTVCFTETPFSIFEKYAGKFYLRVQGIGQFGRLPKKNT